ncbi:MAG: DinB family protein [Ignavibacteriales bacterium]|nr:DinB family protein [Ignavibacteriales bacterium]
MTRAKKLSDELYNSIFGDPWYGSSATDILREISIEQAFRKPIPSAHSIIELTLHITAWTEEILSRFNGNKPSEPQIGDWPTPENYTEKYWVTVKQNLFDATNKLISVLKKFPEEQLDTIIGGERNVSLGTGFSLEGLILGLVEHNSYHLGQISLLKKFF